MEKVHMDPPKLHNNQVFNQHYLQLRFYLFISFDI
jgi:hypothetical protein